MTLRFPNTEKPYIARAYVPGGINSRQRLLGRFATAEEAHIAREQFRKDTLRKALAHEDAFEQSFGPTLPTQTTAPVRNPAILLRAAVVEQAKKDLESERPEISESARSWFRGEYRSQPSFSFRDICDMCDASLAKAVMRLGC